jgi:hypothetical protein
MTKTIHWNYFFAVEDDLATLSRYVQFHEDNFAAYSIETAKILMTAVQEVDVLLKSICGHYGAPAANIRDYHDLMMVKHPNIREAKVTLAQHSLVRMPFSSWSATTPPPWWTANNHVKHARDTKFGSASLENAIDAVSGLLIVNMYHHDIVQGGKSFDMPRALRVFDIRWFGRGTTGPQHHLVYGIPKK